MVGMETHRRATRFPITTSLLYRERGEPEWRQASTINVSHSGVLFRPDGPLPAPDRVLDFVLALPLTGETPASHVRCTGRVVRVAPAEFVGGSSAVAVSIDGYALEGRLPD